MRKAYELQQEEGAINRPPVSVTNHKTLEQRLATFYNVNSEEFPRIQSEEVSWGNAKGNEL